MFAVSFSGVGGLMKMNVTNFQEKRCELWAVCSLMFKCYGLIQYLSGTEERELEGERKKCWCTFLLDYNVILYESVAVA